MPDEARPRLAALPPAKRTTPRRFSEFLVRELIDGFGDTGVWPTADWLAFDIVDVWDHGPIGLSGTAFRHPTLDIVMVEPDGEPPTFMLMDRSRPQFDRILAALSSDLLPKSRRHPSHRGPRFADLPVSSPNGTRVLVSFVVTPASADPQAIHVRLSRVEVA